jgi:hypothetical protein
MAQQETQIEKNQSNSASEYTKKKVRLNINTLVKTQLELKNIGHNSPTLPLCQHCLQLLT